MTISEASAVNVLLSRLYGPLDRREGAMPPSEETIEQAAVYLADRASKALMAGWDGNRVRQAIERGVTA